VNNLPVIATITEEFVLPSRAKVTCAKLGTKTCQVLVSGDDKNSVAVWKVNKDRPQLVFLMIHKMSLCSLFVNLVILFEGLESKQSISAICDLCRVV
jgi:hypothetical protein